MTQTSNPKTAITLRPAKAEDARRTFEWRNHPTVRKASLNPNEISWENHELWFQKSLQNPMRSLLIAELDGHPIGVLRYDIEPHTPASALVSVYLAPEKIGQGYGTILLQAGTEWMKSHNTRTRTIRAEILPSNPASVKVFQKAGYRLNADESNKERLLYDLILR